MIYTLEKADDLARQLKKFASLHEHHLAGQFANLDFWLDETKDALKTIDDYHERFNRIRDAQERWVREHDVTFYNGYCAICDGVCEFDSGGPPAPPRRTSSKDMKQYRQQLVDAAYYFLLRCYHSGHLDEYELRGLCSSIGTSVDPTQL